MRLKYIIIGLAVCAALALALALALRSVPQLFVWLIGDGKVTVSEQTSAEWSRVFQTVGLADLPRDVRWIGDEPFDGHVGRYIFSTEERVAQEWLAHSRSIRTARIMSKPDRKAYLICMHSVKRECAVMLNDLQGKWVRVAVTVMDVREKKVGGKTVPHSCDDVYEELESMLLETNAWHTSFGSR